VGAAAAAACVFNFQPLKVHLAMKLGVMMDAAAAASSHMPSLIFCRWHINAAFAGRPI